MQTSKRPIYIASFLVIGIIAIGCNPSINNHDKTITSDSLNASDTLPVNKPVGKNSVTRFDTLIDKIIFALPEVKERITYVESQGNGKRHLSILLYETPEKTRSKYYWVKVAEDNGGNLVTHFNFYFDTTNSEVKYFDTVNDTILSLGAWRKGMKNAP